MRLRKKMLQDKSILRRVDEIYSIESQTKFEVMTRKADMFNAFNDIKERITNLEAQKEFKDLGDKIKGLSEKVGVLVEAGEAASRMPLSSDFMLNSITNCIARYFKAIKYKDMDKFLIALLGDFPEEEKGDYKTLMERSKTKEERLYSTLYIWGVCIHSSFLCRCLIC